MPELRPSSSLIDSMSFFSSILGATATTLSIFKGVIGMLEFCFGMMSDFKVVSSMDIFSTLDERLTSAS